MPKASVNYSMCWAVDEVHQSVCLKCGTKLGRQPQFRKKEDLHHDGCGGLVILVCGRHAMEVDSEVSYLVTSLDYRTHVYRAKFATPPFDYDWEKP